MQPRTDKPSSTQPPRERSTPELRKSHRGASLQKRRVTLASNFARNPLTGGSAPAVYEPRGKHWPASCIEQRLSRVLSATKALGFHRLLLSGQIKIF